MWHFDVPFYPHQGIKLLYGAPKNKKEGFIWFIKALPGSSFRVSSDLGFLTERNLWNVLRYRQSFTASVGSRSRNKPNPSILQLDINWKKRSLTLFKMTTQTSTRCEHESLTTCARIRGGDGGKSHQGRKGTRRVGYLGLISWHLMRPTALGEKQTGSVSHPPAGWSRRSRQPRMTPFRHFCYWEPLKPPSQLDVHTFKGWAQ